MIPGLKKRAVNFYDLMMYGALAYKHARLMVLIICLTSMTGVTYYVYVRPVYHVRALVRTETLRRPVDADAAYSGTPGDVPIQTFLSPTIIERTAARLGIHKSWHEIYRQDLKKLTFHSDTQRNLEVDVWMFNRELALKWTEAMVAEFVAFREERRITYRESLMKSYTREMTQVGQKLDDSVTARFAFEEERNAEKSLIELNELSNIPTELTDTKRRLGEMERIRLHLDDPARGVIEKLSMITSFKKRQLSLGQVVKESDMPKLTTESGSAKAANVVVVPSMVATPERWETLEREMRRIQDEMTLLLQKYKSGNTHVVKLQKELAGITAEVEIEYQTQRGRFDLDYKALRQQVEDLEAKLPDYQDANKRYSKLQQQFQCYQQTQLGWGGMYAYMAKELSELDFAQAKERYDLFYDGILEAKPAPESPNRIRLILMSLGVGLAAAIAVPFGIEYLDHTIADFEQAETMFQIRGLGIIPALEPSEVERTMLMDSEDAHHQNLLENFRVIRTNLLSMGALTKAPQVIMVTSAVPKEGKTIVSSNLALSFAQMGAKTLLLDADLRRGRLHRMFGLRKLPGLTQLLMGKCAIEDACRPCGRENLHVLTAGEHLNTAAEMLSAPKFGEVLAELRKRYDRIVVDTPPVLGLSETCVIQSLMDGVIFVAWAGKTPIKSMQLAVEMLQNNGANFYGFILNRLDLADSSNYYQYYYYSNDYYRNYHALENA